MFTKHQGELLRKFADLSDQLFTFGVTTTDSFTGEIGEYVACRHFKLNKSKRVTKAVDGVCELGNKYQVKAKVVSSERLSYRIDKLDTSSIDYLAVVFFDRLYCPIKIIRIPASVIKNNKISITTAYLNSGVEIFEKDKIKLPAKEKRLITEFAAAYNELEANGITRSRRIVGDIGEQYACKYLGLELCNNKTEKGIDARHKGGLTFEVKTRRVYESGRRVDLTRRLNNVDGKTADYLVVVALDREFRCAGMWLVPMANIANPKSAHLDLVNYTPGTLNVVPSKVSWLNTGERFKGFKAHRPVLSNPQEISSARNKQAVKAIQSQTKARPKKVVPELNSIQRQQPVNAPTKKGGRGCVTLVAIIVILYYLFKWL